MLHRLFSSKTTTLLVVFLLSAAAAAADPQSPAKPSGDPATWTPEVRSQYEAIRALPPEPKDAVLLTIRKLAALGSQARPAIMALAADRSLPEPHRAWSGILGTSYARYDAKALRGIAQSHRNPYARREAIDLLADIGGPAGKRFLEALARKDAGLRDYIAQALARMPAVEPLSEDDRRLLSDLLLEPVERKRAAAVLLVDRHKGRTTLDAALERLAAQSVADTDTQIYAGVALARIHVGDVPKLKSFAARDRHRFIRYYALDELARSGPDGRAVLRELAAAPDEPLKPFIEKWLAK